MKVAKNTETRDKSLAILRSMIASIKVTIDPAAIDNLKIELHGADLRLLQTNSDQIYVFNDEPWRIKLELWLLLFTA